MRYFMGMLSERGIDVDWEGGDVRGLLLLVAGGLLLLEIMSLMLSLVGGGECGGENLSLVRMPGRITMDGRVRWQRRRPLMHGPDVVYRRRWILDLNSHRGDRELG